MRAVEHAAQSQFDGAIPPPIAEMAEMVLSVTTAGSPAPELRLRRYLIGWRVPRSRKCSASPWSGCSNHVDAGKLDDQRTNPGRGRNSLTPRRPTIADHGDRRQDEFERPDQPAVAWGGLERVAVADHPRVEANGPPAGALAASASVSSS